MVYGLKEFNEILEKNKNSDNITIDGSLNLRNTPITSLPEGLTVGGDLDLRNTPITSLPEGLTVGGYLDLSDTLITSLPKGLTVGGSLYLSNTPITSLPEGLTVGGYLYLSNTPITSLPEGLTVGGYLDLSGTSITSLPAGLTVGGSLYLSNTPITSLPEGLTVGGGILLNENLAAKTKELNYMKLKNGDYVPGKYLFADNILTHVKREKKIGRYKYYIGKIKNQNVISDGKYYAHCRTFREGIKDLEFKRAKERGAEQYKKLSLDSVMNPDEAITMYRIITGACAAGTEHFVKSLGKLKDSYTVSEIIKITEGQYNNNLLKSFFGVD